MAIQTTGLLSPYLREQRIKAVKKHIKGKVLDLGCGVGKLTELIKADDYVGIDIDKESIDEAKKSYPNYTFFEFKEFEINDNAMKFDTIVSMAVIEHVKNPEEFLTNLVKYLKEDGSIVLTTPHPKADWMHDLGSKIGLFSSHANEEHEELIDEAKIKEIVKNIGLRLDVYERFLFGVNQLMIIKK